MNADLYAAYWAARFGVWLRRTMNAKGLRRVDVVRRSGTGPTGRPVIDNTTLGRWLPGDTLPTVEKLLALAAALDVEPAEVLAAGGYTYPPDAAPPAAPQSLAVLVDDEDEQTLLATVLNAYRNTKPTHERNAR